MLKYALGALAVGLMLLPSPANAQTYISHPNIGTIIHPYPSGTSMVHAPGIASPNYYMPSSYYSFPAYHTYSNQYPYPVYASNINNVPPNYRQRFFTRWRY